MSIVQPNSLFKKILNINFIAAAQANESFGSVPGIKPISLLSKSEKSK